MCKLVRRSQTSPFAMTYLVGGECLSVPTPDKTKIIWGTGVSLRPDGAEGTDQLEQGARIGVTTAIALSG